MAHSVRLRFLLALAAFSAAIHAPVSAENWISLEVGQVDRDSFRREGTWVYYHSRILPTWPGDELRVDCSQTGSSELVVEMMIDGKWREFRITSDTHRAEEVRYVCSAV